MTIKVSVKGRFVYNGKVYGSLEELPEHVREAYEKATAGAAPGVGGGAPGARVKVVFNGTEYESVDAMPPEARRLYEDAIGAMQSGHLGEAGAAGLPEGRSAEPGGGAVQAMPVTAAPIEPGGAASRSNPLAIVIGLALLLMLLGFYLYHSAAAR